MKREEKYRDHKYFHYYNANNHNHKVGDCVVRAIATATQQSWEKVYDGLYKIGRHYGYMPNDDQCIKKYLTGLGWEKMKEPRDVNNKKIDVIRFIDYYWPEDHRSVIANVGSHHMVAINEGVVHDIWDSSRQTMHSYWIKK